MPTERSLTTLRRRGRSLLLATLAALSLTLAARAEALVYWVNNGDGTIGRANLNGTAADPSFIVVAGSLQPTYGVAVSDEHIYWASGAGWIGRANLDGTGVDPDFIPTAAGGGASEVEVDDRHIFWSNGSFGWIGRAKLNGTDINQQLLPPQSGSVPGLAVNDNFLYWADYQNSRIGRGELATLGVDPLFINATADRPEGLAVDDAHIYWSNGSGNTIGRASLNGTGVDQAFIPTAYAYGVEVDDEHLFWANYDTNSIGRASLDGSLATPNFILGADAPEGVAIDWIANRGAGLSIVKVKRNRKRGTAKVTVRVSGPGKLIARGKGLHPVRRSAGRERVILPARPTGALKRKLAVRGKATARVRITFRPTLSERSKTKAQKLSLRKRR